MPVEIGRWIGPSGGGLEITALDGLALTGRYSSRLGNVPVDWFPATGFTDGRVIGFAVLWRNPEADAHSVTSWSGRWLAAGEAGGQGDAARERLELNWHLHRLFENGDPEKPVALWQANLSNVSVLYRTD